MVADISYQQEGNKPASFFIRQERKTLASRGSTRQAGEDLIPVHVWKINRRLSPASGSTRQAKKALVCRGVVLTHLRKPGNKRSPFPFLAFTYDIPADQCHLIIDNRKAEAHRLFTGCWTHTQRLIFSE